MKKSKTRYLSVLLTFALLVAMVPVFGIAAPAFADELTDVYFEPSDSSAPYTGSTVVSIMVNNPDSVVYHAQVVFTYDASIAGMVSCDFSGSVFDQGTGTNTFDFSTPGQVTINVHSYNPVRPSNAPNKICDLTIEGVASAGGTTTLDFDDGACGLETGQWGGGDLPADWLDGTFECVVESEDNTVYFDPSDSSADYGDTATVGLWIDAVDALGGGLVNFTYDDSIGEVTAYTADTTDWDFNNGNIGTAGEVSIGFSSFATEGVTGLIKIGDVTIEGVSVSGDTTDLEWAAESYLQDTGGTDVSVTWEDGTFACSQPDLPDLVVIEKYEEWIDSFAGTYNVTYTVENQGPAAAAASTTQVDIDGSVTTYACPALASGASDTQTVGPFTLSGDFDTITVTADINDDVEEITNANNSATNTLSEVPKPDLVVTEKSEEWINEEEGTYNVTYTVHNQGYGDAGASTTQVDIDGSVTTYACPALASGESDTQTVGPFTASGDSDDITITADVNNDVQESNEENNSLGNTLTMGTRGSTTLSGVLAEGYVSITVPSSLEIPLEKGTTNYLESSVDIDSNIPWQLDVEDEKTDNKGYMVSTEDDVLQHPMMVNHDATSIDLSTSGGGTLATGAGPESVAVEFEQQVEYSDAPGAYEITVTFTVFGTF
jgi:hypothetical protein